MQAVLRGRLRATRFFQSHRSGRGGGSTFSRTVFGFSDPCPLHFLFTSCKTNLFATERPDHRGVEIRSCLCLKTLYVLARSLAKGCEQPLQRCRLVHIGTGCRKQNDSCLATRLQTGFKPGVSSSGQPSLFCSYFAPWGAAGLYTPQSKRLSSPDVQGVRLALLVLSQVAKEAHKEPQLPNLFLCYFNGLATFMCMRYWSRGRSAYLA